MTNNVQAHYKPSYGSLADRLSVHLLYAYAHVSPHLVDCTSDISCSAYLTQVIQEGQRRGLDMTVSTAYAIADPIQGLHTHPQHRDMDLARQHLDWIAELRPEEQRDLVMSAAKQVAGNLLKWTSNDHIGYLFDAIKKGVQEYITAQDIPQWRRRAAYAGATAMVCLFVLGLTNPHPAHASPFLQGGGGEWDPKVDGGYDWCGGWVPPDVYCRHNKCD